jgi:hypothetical protein
MFFIFLIKPDGIRHIHFQLVAATGGMAISFFFVGANVAIAQLFPLILSAIFLSPP